jgi:hypothetical protein
MPIPTSAVTAAIEHFDATALAGGSARVSYALSSAAVASGILIAPPAIDTFFAPDGTCTSQVWPNAGDTYYRVTVYDRFNHVVISGYAVIQGPCNLADVLVTTPPAPLPGKATVDLEVPSGAVDGVNRIFVLAHAPSPQAGCIGYVQQGGAGAFLPAIWGIDFVLTGAVITMTQAPDAGSRLRFSYRY